MFVLVFVGVLVLGFVSSFVFCLCACVCVC